MRNIKRSYLKRLPHQVQSTLRALHLRNRFQSASETARHWQGNAQISRQTVVRRLADHGLKCRRPVQKQGLLPRHVAARLAWATHHRRWTIRQWSNVIWSDEKCFVVDKKDGRIRCYRRRNERFRQPNIHQYGPKQTIMIWAAISADGKSNIIRFNGNVTVRRYQDEALLPGLIPFLNRHNQQVLFMQDNATPHRAHTYFLLFGSLIHRGVSCSHCLPRRLPPSLPVVGRLEGSVHGEPCPLFDIVNIGSSGSALASFSFWFALYNSFCEIKIFLSTHVSKVGHFSFYNNAK